jgi:hypothetical protein
MKPTPEMLKAALEAYWNCEGDSGNVCMSEALEAALQAMWQPIESAPKDGTYVLVKGPGVYPCTVFWNGNSWDDGDFHDRIPATHWVPLPDAPENT